LGTGLLSREIWLQAQEIDTGMTSTKRLFVLRHAKSSWDNPGLDDHERPLAPRGRRAVEVMAAYLQTAGIRPQLVLCSSSRRTRETLAGIEVAGEHVVDRALYAATCEEVLARLRQLPEHVTSVMLIGHNPTVQMLVLRLSNHDGSGLADPRRDAVKRKFPTGALATLSFDCAWAELASGRAQLEEFVTPKGFSGKPEVAVAAPGHPA
jgi:phosphohistidine phosphatase